MNYEFHPEALDEYQEATLWYAKRDKNAALRFVTFIEDAIERVVTAPTRWRVIDEDIRRCLTHVFPYAILYTIEDDFILIVAVMHVSRAPGYWKSRIDRS